MAFHRSGSTEGRDHPRKWSLAPLWCRSALACLITVGLSIGSAALADQRDARLGPLFERLAHPASVRDSRAAEAAIWRIWTDSGSAEVDQLMERGIIEMSTRRLDQAIATFSRVIKLAPDFAEGWNKRATAYYLNDELAESVRDIQRTLALEPRHFGALSGMGLIFLRRKDYTGAMQAYREVLKLNPNAEGLKERVERLRRLIRDKVV